MNVAGPFDEHRMPCARIGRTNVLKKSLSFLAAALIMVGASPAQAAWPERPVRILVPFTAGGSSDVLARIIGEALAAKIGQPVVVENRPGGNSMIAMQAAATAPADGYTLIVGHIGTHAITPAITPPNGYDVAKSFATVAVHASSANVLVTNPSKPFRNLKAMLDVARSKPGTLNYGSPGAGSPAHIAILQLAAFTDVNVVHVPYRGNSAAITDLLAGTIDFLVGSPAETLEHVRAGKLKALATTGEQRSKTTPDLPTIAEVTGKPFKFRTWHVVSIRSDTPSQIVDALRKSVSEVLASEDYKKRLADLGLDSGVSNGVEAEKFVQSEILQWAKFVKEAGVRAE
jgi:tripartite-type tricarboxylate transporter receptor subunit TctC